MRKIAIFILSVLSLSVISGCESKEGDYETLATVKVVSSDLVFQPSGGTGTVMFTASGPVTVESSRPWCTATVNGGSITVNVEEYEGYDNRYADIVIKSGDYSTKVTAHQYGLYFSLPEAEDFYHVNDVNGQVAIQLTHYNHKPAGVADVDWLSTSYEDDKVIIKAKDNTTGKVRAGRITIGDKTIEIQQWSFDTVFGGEYDWAGTTSSTGTVTGSMPVTLSDYDDEKGTFRIHFNILENASVEMPFDPETFTFTISGGQYVGETVYNNSPAYIYTVLYASGYISWSSNYKASFTFRLDETTGKYYASIEDIGSWDGKEVSGVYLELFNARSASSSTRLSVMTAKRLYNNILYQK